MPLKRIFLPFLFFLTSVFAHCPLCVAATGGAVIGAKLYGVDNLVIGTFIGGFIISTAFWFDLLLRKKNKGDSYLPFQLGTIILLSFLLTFSSFLSVGIFSDMVFNERILIGILVGSIITIAAFTFNDFIRKINGGKSYIPFQVVFFTLAFLLLVVFIYYLLKLI